LAGLKTGQISPGRFSKAFGKAPRNLLSNRSEGLKLADFEKLSAELLAAVAYTAT
jgi:hypothetical protein